MCRYRVLSLFFFSIWTVVGIFVLTDRYSVKKCDETTLWKQQFSTASFARITKSLQKMIEMKILEYFPKIFIQCCLLVEHKVQFATIFFSRHFSLNSKYKWHKQAPSILCTRYILSKLIPHTKSLSIYSISINLQVYSYWTFLRAVHVRLVIPQRCHLRSVCLCSWPLW